MTTGVTIENKKTPSNDVIFLQVNGISEIIIAFHYSGICLFYIA